MRPRLRDDGMIHWYSIRDIDTDDVKDLFDFVGNLKRTLLFNTGGHGNMFGGNPTMKGKGVGQFIQDDLLVAYQKEGCFIPFIVIPGVEPQRYPGADSADLWCFSS